MFIYIARSSRSRKLLSVADGERPVKSDPRVTYSCRIAFHANIPLAPSKYQYSRYVQLYARLKSRKATLRVI